TIYYTRNGTLPTNKSNKYNTNTQLNISIKTQINAILQDKQLKQSENKFYQAPQIITLPIVTVNVYSYYYQISETQLIYENYFRMDENQETYYTTDNTNPKNSSTRKIMKYSPKIQNMCFNITNNTIVKYYTKDTKLNLTSNIYTYKPLKNQSEEITITILNTTPLYTKGAINTKKEEKVKIEVNELNSLVNVAQDDTNNWNSLNDKEEYTLNNTSKIIIKARYKPKIKEYDLKNGLRTRMNYTYTMKIPYQQVTVYNNSFNINLTKNTIKNNLTNKKTYFYSTSSKQLIIINNTEINEPGFILYKNNTYLYLKSYNYVYGDVNQVSIIKKLIRNNLIEVSTISNGNIKDTINIYLPNLYYTTKTLSSTKKQLQLHDIQIDAIFASNTLNPQTRSEVLKAYVSNKNRIEVIDTFLLCNKKISSTDMDSWLNKKNQYNTSSIKYACYGMMLTELSYVYYNGKFSEEFIKKLNSTDMFVDNYQLLISTVAGGDTYIDAQYGTGYYLASDNQTKIYSYNIWSGFTASYLEKYCLEFTGLNASSATYDFIKDLSENKNMHVKVRNNTLTLNTENNTNYTIIINERGEVASIIHNIMLPILSNTITINSSDYDEFIKTNTSANGGVIHRDESDIRFMKDDVDKIYIVSDKYNKNWLKLTSQINAYVEIARYSWGLIPLAGISFHYLSTPGSIIGIFFFILETHKVAIYFRDNQWNSSDWNKYFTHKNYLDDYDYVEIYNTSSPNKVDIVEIPYTKFGYDRENAVYIDYETGARKMTVQETYLYFPEENL
ncbi:MAG: chitobiase/beta-hexosaminidase C-terminal domain-containing protein, partial [Methanosphaera sp.]